MPVAPASLSVWQLAQPAVVNTFFPAASTAGLGPVAVGGGGSAALSFGSLATRITVSIIATKNPKETRM